MSVSSLMPQFFDKIAILREAALHFAASRGIDPPSFWPAKQATSNIEATCKQTLSAEVTAACERGEQLTKDDLWAMVQKDYPTIRRKGFDTRIWPEIAPAEWRRQGRLKTPQ